MGVVEITLKAFAKLNLYLEVLGPREDGYHDVRSLMVTVDLADIVQVRDARSALSVVVDAAGVPSGEDNLCWEAADALRRRAGIRKGADIRLTKRIPVAAGLGGGSSDAACVLAGLNSLWGTGLTQLELEDAAAGVGSDVPFFIRGGLQLAEGRGEKLTALEGLPQAWFVIAAPQEGVSSAWAYSAVKMGLTTATHTTRMTLLSTTLDPAGLAGILQNDLERGVEDNHPVVRRLKAALLAHGAAGSMMSGSGPAVFGVTKDRTSAIALASAVRGPGVATFAVAATRRGWAEVSRV